MGQATVDEWEFALSQPREALWPILADTARLNEAMEIPALRVAPVTTMTRDDLPASARLGWAVETLDGAQRWIESAYEWVRGQWWQVERWFDAGPIAHTRLTLALHRNEAGGTLGQLRIESTSRGRAGGLLMRGGLVRKQGEELVRLAHQVDGWLSGKRPTPFQLPRKLRASREGLAEKTASLQDDPLAHGAGEALIDWLLGAQEAELISIRPRRLAKMFGLSERDGFELALAATRQGVLRPDWQFCCPRCRQVLHHLPKLELMPPQLACARCNIEVPVDLAAHVELCFQPQFQGAIACRCPGGPAAAPQIWVQQVLDPGERLVLEPDLRPGLYRLRAGSPARDQPLEVAAGALLPAIRLMPKDQWRLEGGTHPGKLVIENHDTEPRLVVIDRREWRADALSVAEALTQQAMREVMPHAAPPPALTPRTGRPVFAMLELARPDLPYALADDAGGARLLQSLSARLRALARHHHGALFRDHGHRFAAVFIDPVAALDFCVEGLRLLIELFGAGGTMAEGWAALAHGPALYVARGGGGDYAGLAPALADRLLQLAAESEILLPLQMAEDHDIAARLAAIPMRQEYLDLGGEADQLREIAYYRLHIEDLP